MTSPVDALLASLNAALERKKFHTVDFFEPYPKQLEFFRLGATKKERLLRAGNQLGKTYAGAAEMAYHLTGQYPTWWEGRRFDHPIRAWCAGVKSILVRDGPQKLLCGTPGVIDDFGTGFIPKPSFADKPSLSRGVTDAFDTIQVKHYTNGVYDGISTLTFKSYEEGREKFQSTTLDLIWCDEEPPADIYSECLARLTATNGSIYITFTPLKGRSVVVQRFLTEADIHRSDTVITIYDVKHILDPAAEIAKYPAHERDARVMGTPMMGEGRIFPIDEAAIAEDAIPGDRIPPFWTKLWGIDFGISHPFAAVLILWDRDNDVIHVHSALRIKDAIPLQHAAMMKPIGAMVKVAWPADGDNREHSTGKTLADAYKQQGLLMLPEHATWPDGTNSTEAGITDMHARMETGRFKVARHILNGDWGDEFRNYHRLKGEIVKLQDDLMSATRVAVMARRHGTTAILGYGNPRARTAELKPIADGVDFDLFS
jgi:phage terminase large subunit-like protein